MMSKVSTMKIKSIFILLCTTVLLSSCGWQLRGSNQGNGTYPDAIYFSSKDQYSDLTRDFNKALQRRQIKVDLTLESPKIELIKESTHNSTASLNALLDPGESQIDYRLQYMLNGETYTVKRQRVYQHNKNRAAARDNEKRIITSELRNEAIDSVLNQMLQLDTP